MRIVFLIYLIALCVVSGPYRGLAQEPGDDRPVIIEPCPSPKDHKYIGAGPIEIWQTERFYSSLIVVGKENLHANDGLKYMPRNVGEKPIKAFVFVLDDGTEKQLLVGIYSNQQVDPGKEFPGGYLMNRATVPVFEIDLVMFTDGTFWGADRHGQSSAIENYYKGRETAIKRAAAMMEQESTDIIWQIVKGPYSRGWVEKLPSPIRDTRSQFMSGYDEVVSNLSHGPDDLKQIAEKLKAMESVGVP
jgi:hypothetical protein